MTKWDLIKINPDITDDDWVTGQLANNYTSYVAKNQAEGVALDEVFLRYQYSNYVIDPNRYRFRKVVRIVGLVYLFVKKPQEEDR